MNNKIIYLEALDRRRNNLEVKNKHSTLDGLIVRSLSQCKMDFSNWQLVSGI